MPTTPASDAGWPDAPGDTALTIHIPEADALVRTPSRAHVTVLYPFLPLDRVTDATERELRTLFAATPAFPLTFAAIRRWPGVLYLPPAPDDPLRALTKSLRERWPEAVPYRGVFGDEGLDPHLTLASGWGTDDIPESEFTGALPLYARVESVRLIVTEAAGTGWRDIRTYPLGPQLPA
ncbi:MULTISPECIES: 2'-5' RNA ligase family protein [unclassified Streptomyces]|uniref:2'-5' RNA ligase family protein n=1 Tax=unclassified Streptomyces TaxID=2593676 RepID=UPI00278C4780|nr:MULTISPECIES: 2'-5' RNA ligase family protein [unclassified Streptomyces]